MEIIKDNTEIQELKKALQEANHKQCALRDEISSLNSSMEKAAFLLGELLDAYAWSEAPSPKEAMQWSGSKPNGATEQQANSAKWFIEYDTIIQKITIAADYMMYKLTPRTGNE